jgi:hypothetical protein
MPAKTLDDEVNLNFAKKPSYLLMKVKGWTLETVAERWGISDRQIRNLFNNPTPREWDAINGLPNKVEINYANPKTVDNKRARYRVRNKQQNNEKKT